MVVSWDANQTPIMINMKLFSPASMGENETKASKRNPCHVCRIHHMIVHITLLVKTLVSVRAQSHPILRHALRSRRTIDLRVS